MSSGDLTIDGATAHYQLRMPLYEITHVASPETTLLAHIQFAGAALVSRKCSEDSARGLYVCDADYRFDSPPKQVDVECTFAAITVSNHVHLLRAEMGGKHDQGVFDGSFTHTVLRFRPPTRMEVAITEGGAGIVRALGGAVQIVFLFALALAARSRRELLTITAMFLAGQALTMLVAPHTLWQPAPRFVEAAAALTVAYLAVEILLLPQAGARWLVAGVLGAFHGLYFFLFVQSTGYRPGFVLAGAAVAETIVVGVLALLLSRIARMLRALRPVTVSASALLVFGMVWFLMRLRN